MVWRFFFYGLIGWGMEVFWTGLHSLLHKDVKLIGTTSLWMFPIYGMVVFLEPIYGFLAASPWLLRGGVYMICIFAAEFASGWWLENLVGYVPWDYSDAKLNIKGLIRLDYAPVWFAVGLIYERIYSFISYLPLS